MKRNKFNLSNDVVLSGNMGDLIPVSCVEVLPGDTFRGSVTAMVRAAPLLAPIMTPTHMMVHSFFVPNRLLWDQWENFITGGPDGTSEPVFPTIEAPDGGWPIGSLADYLGLPTEKEFTSSALPFRALAKIFNENFRDQDLEDPIPLSVGSGLDTTTSTALQRVAWGKDYFTTARPTPQKGPEVFLPLGTSAPVRGIGRSIAGANGTSPQSVIETNGQTYSYSPHRDITGTNFYAKMTSASAGTPPDITVDLTEASAVSIEDLRFASALQRYYEAMSQYGSRYVEYLRTMFGVKSSDARLQRPEYLGGGISTLQFSEVLQTAEGTDPVGQLRGHGIGALRSNRYERFFEEHGYVITLVSVKPVSIYMNGIHRAWNRRTKEDFYNPFFQNLGQQSVLNKEIYADGTAADEQVFGYQDRYDEYRSLPSRVSGEFRDTLNFWHMARDFAARPALNADFIKANPTDRIYAVTSSDQLYFMLRNNIVARRAVAKRANPMLK